MYHKSSYDIEHSELLFTDGVYKIYDEGYRWFITKGDYIISEIKSKESFDKYHKTYEKLIVNLVKREETKLIKKQKLIDEYQKELNEMIKVLGN